MRTSVDEVAVAVRDREAIHEISALRAGQTARLRLERDGRTIVVRVRVRLGSLKDAIPALLSASSWRLADR